MNLMMNAIMEENILMVILNFLMILILKNIKIKYMFWI